MSRNEPKPRGGAGISVCLSVLLGAVGPLMFTNCSGGSDPATPNNTATSATSCYPGSWSNSATPSSWASTKATQAPLNHLPSEFNAPASQGIASMGWEDGIYITRDGLNLYAVFIPADTLGFVLSGASLSQFYTYLRGPQLGQDFSNPLGASYEWLHGDVVYASRASTSQSFGCWSLTGLKTQYYNRGAPVGILNSASPSTFDYFAYTDDRATASSPSGGAKIQLVRNSPLNPNNAGNPLPNNVSGNAYVQDNPHIERINAGNPNQLALFFESTNWPGSPGGNGTHAILFTTSSDGGTTWTNPAFVTTINTASGQEQQPHLYNDGASWWLYFTAVYPSDGKLAIYRAQQQTVGNFDSWGTRQLVISAGTTAGVGEPSLTSHGDLSFVVVFANASGTSTDTYDADPWFMQHK